MNQIIELSCDRPSHRYHVGENTRFTVRCAAAVPLTVELSVDGEAVLDTFEVTAPAEFAGTLPFPGFLRCTVSAPELGTVYCGAAYDPDRIRPLFPEPPEFAELWRDFDTTPHDLHVRELEPGLLALDCASFNGLRHYALLALPPGKGPFPLVVEVEGGEAYTSSEVARAERAAWSDEWGLNAAVLSMQLPPYPIAETCEESKLRHAAYLETHGLKRFIYINLDKGVRDLYLYPAILGGSRLIAAAAARPEIDATRIGCFGASHGGGFGLYYTAFSGHIKAAFCGVPDFGDMGGCRAGRHTPDCNSPELRSIWKKLLCFDTAYCARRITVPVLMSAGFVDRSCPPTAVYAAFNALNGPKLMFDKVENGHGDAPPEYGPLCRFWLKQHLQ